MADGDSDEWNYGQTPPTPSAPAQPKTTGKKMWVLAGSLIIIVIVAVLFFLAQPKTFSDSEISSGISIEMKEDSETKFILGDEEHTITVDSVEGETINLIINSATIMTNLTVGEEKKFDLDDDGTYDLKIKLVGVENGVASITVKKISEEICVEDWSCDDWSACTELNNQTRNCIDLNSCGTRRDKPILVRSCAYTKNCTENWSCTGWGSCIDGKQTRSCTDLNSCGTTTNKPYEQQNCTIPVEDCGIALSNYLGENDTAAFDCFIAASEDCSHAKLLWKNTVDFLGLMISTVAHMELNGTEANKCIYYQRIEDQTVKFGEYLVQQALENNVTAEEIEQQEQEATAEARETVVGLERTCKFYRTDLTAMLTRWKNGNFSSEEFDAAECIESNSSTFD